VLLLHGCSPAAWMCYKHQVKLKKLNEARYLVDEDLRLLPSLKKADSDSVPLTKRPGYSVLPESIATLR